MERLSEHGPHPVAAEVDGWCALILCDRAHWWIAQKGLARFDELVVEVGCVAEKLSCDE